MKLSDHERAQGGTVTLSDEQFDKLVELLTPGYEVALEYKKQMDLGAKYQADAQAKAAVPSADPLPPDREPSAPEVAPEPLS